MISQGVSAKWWSIHQAFWYCGEHVYICLYHCHDIMCSPLFTRSGLMSGPIVAHSLFLYEIIWLCTLVIYLSQNLYQNRCMFLDLAQIHSQNTFWQLILMISGGKRKSDNWITRWFVSECQNTYLNQIWTIIIYREEMPNPEFNYFIRKKSEYVLGFYLTKINNSVF